MSTPTPPVSLATADDFAAFGSLSEIFRNSPDPLPDTALIRASRAIESRCDRRLLPFTGLIETHRAEGVDMQGQPGPGWPMDLPGALGRSKAAAYGTGSLVRDFWLREYAPTRADLWTATVSRVDLTPSIGGPTVSGPVEGPDVDTGHIRLPLGTYCPPGTTVRIVYSGGYNPIPEDLVEACLLQAVRTAMLGAEPQTRQGMSFAELDLEIASHLAPYVRV